MKRHPYTEYVVSAAGDDNDVAEFGSIDEAFAKVAEMEKARPGARFAVDTVTRKTIYETGDQPIRKIA